tara:strand:- start:482 stop:1111 length:630 start_codon:yes stop_codon:yes gene_type:complete
MNKNLLIIFIYLFLTSGCTSSTSLNKIDSNLTIDEFSMTQFENNGDKLYSISSPKCIFDKEKQIYKLNETEIFFYKKNYLNYVINSQQSSLLDNNKYIKLEGEVKLFDLNNKNNNIKANNAFWNIEKSEFLLEGNVILNNNSLNLISSKAILNQKTKVIKFFRPVKYRYLNNSSKLNYQVSADNAFYNLDDKKLLFESEKERIKSRLTF